MINLLTDTFAKEALENQLNGMFLFDEKPYKILSSFIMKISISLRSCLM